MKDAEAANGIFQTTATGIKLLLPEIYLPKLPNVRIKNGNPQVHSRLPALGLTKRNWKEEWRSSATTGRCEETVPRNHEPLGNEPPRAKASGMRAQRHTGLLPRVFTFPSRVGVG